PDRYTQHTLSFYGEVGLISRWLTATLEGQLYRRNILDGQGFTDGMGDLRIGAWTGLLRAPVRLSLGFTAGVPAGDAAPRGADQATNDIAHHLPTGDGEFDFEWRLALGHAFGGARRWPLLHYAILEAGYWLRTHGIHDSIVYKAELGTR